MLKLIGKVLLVPVWILVAIAWLLIKVAVGIYSFARGFVVFGIVFLIVGTIYCYHDWIQVLFLSGISGVTFAILFAGTFVEVGLETIKNILGRVITAQRN